MGYSVHVWHSNDSYGQSRRDIGSQRRARAPGAVCRWLRPRESCGPPDARAASPPHARAAPLVCSDGTSTTPGRHLVRQHAPRPSEAHACHRIWCGAAPGGHPVAAACIKHPAVAVAAGSGEEALPQASGKVPSHKAACTPAASAVASRTRAARASAFVGTRQPCTLSRVSHEGRGSVGASAADHGTPSRDQRCFHRKVAPAPAAACRSVRPAGRSRETASGAATRSTARRGMQGMQTAQQVRAARDGADHGGRRASPRAGPQAHAARFV